MTTLWFHWYCWLHCPNNTFWFLMSKPFRHKKDPSPTKHPFVTSPMLEEGCFLNIKHTWPQSLIYHFLCSSRKPQWALQPSFQWGTASWWEASFLKVCFPSSVRGCWNITYWENYLRGKCHRLSGLNRTIFCSLSGSVFFQKNKFFHWWRPLYRRKETAQHGHF